MLREAEKSPSWGDSLYKTFVLCTEDQEIIQYYFKMKSEYYILGSDTKLNFSGSHQNHTSFASGSSYCSEFSWFIYLLLHSIQWVSTDLLAGCLHTLSFVQGHYQAAVWCCWCFWKPPIFYRTKISSGGILSQSNAVGSTLTRKTQF